MPIESISLPLTNDIQELRKGVEMALQRLAIKLDDGRVYRDLEVGGHRIKNLSRPVDDNDAVNVAFLKEMLKQHNPTNLTRRQQYLLQTPGGGGGTSTTTIGTGYQLEVLAP
jgi:hypothetical protein